LRDHHLPIRSLAFRPDGRLLASAADDRTVVVHDLHTGHPVRTLAGVDAVRVRGSADRLLVVSREPVARLWPWRDGAPVELRGHAGDVTDGWFLAGDTQVLTISADGTARLWAAADGAPLRTFRSDLGPLRCAAVDEQAGLLAVTGDAPQLQLFALATGSA